MWMVGAGGISSRLVGLLGDTGGPVQAGGPKLCPVQNYLDGDGYLAPGWLTKRSLIRKQAETNAAAQTLH